MTEHKCNHDHESKNDHKCGNDNKCDHNHDQDSEEFDTIILTDDDGQDHEFLHLDTLDLEGSTYFVLMPINEGDEESEASEDADADEDADEAIILKLGKDDEGNDMLLDIEDDEEWEKVADAWENMEE
ncbi:MAG: DUF1292 domain-containing protein [Desulfitobacteriaceae bacterium]